MMGKIVAIILNRINITLFKEKVKLVEFCTYLLTVLVDSYIIDTQTGCDFCGMVRQQVQIYIKFRLLL
jgi:hypothetical protein